ncbi:ATP-binding protein [Thiocystis violacea]|uniref:ATP-binding protein n=1 Tax=Thiocystis violacea TaxID=13725 RepID=UPI00190562B1|nr:ATP-binding protein [Thiocystis violacea]MBK1721460.1 hypothetical protein [Thiocystis violacea]
MSSLFRDVSVRWKVIAVVMLVTTVVLGISSLVVIVMDVISMRNALVERVGALSRVAAINMAAPLAFQDPGAAEEILAALGSEEDVIRIQVLTAEGQLFADYLSPRPRYAGRLATLVDEAQAARAREPQASGGGVEPVLSFRSGYLDLHMSVLVDGKTLGYMDLQYDTTELSRRILYQGLVALLVFIGGTGIAFLLAARLHGLISGPIREIAEIMGRTATHQDFSVRLDAHQKDELGTLMRAFNTMLEQIELRDVELRKARDAAEAGSEAKSQFLVSMSHEIRTPMNGILGMAELLSGTSLDARQQHFTQTIQVSAESLLAIINDILDFSKIEAGRLDLERLDFDLCAILDRTLDLLHESARAKGLALRARIPAGFPGWVRGDPGRLQQVLTNLLSNAIKFTERGSVQLTLSVLEETAAVRRVRIAVADTGIGLAPDQREPVFERFSQADSSTSRRYGGTGLGLSISKQLVELMGGDIAVESALGQGSVFRIDLPLEKSPGRVADQPRDFGRLRVLLVTSDPRTQADLERQCAAWDLQLTCRVDLHDAMELALNEAMWGRGFDVFLLEQAQLPALEVPAGRVLRDLIEQASGAAVLVPDALSEGVDYAWGRLRTLATPVASSGLAAYLSAIIEGRRLRAAQTRPELGRAPAGGQPNLGLNVLVAEDNEVNQEVIDSMLKALGCRVTLCADGKVALTALAEQAPDLILMDCQMPSMDGYETTRRIRAREARQGGRVPIIALTAHAMRGDRERALAAGMDDFLSKPFKLVDLTALLQQWGAKPQTTEAPSAAASVDRSA